MLWTSRWLVQLVVSERLTRQCVVIVSIRCGVSIPIVIGPAIVAFRQWRRRQIVLVLEMLNRQYTMC